MGQTRNLWNPKAPLFKQLSLLGWKNKKLFFKEQGGLYKKWAEVQCIFDRSSQKGSIYT